MLATRMRMSTTPAVLGVYVAEDHDSILVSSPVTFTNLIPSRATQVRIVVAIGWAYNLHRTISSITIAGVAATARISESVGGGTDVAIYDALVPAGAAGNLVVTFSGDVDLVMASIYNLGAAVYRTGDADTGSASVSLSLTARAGEYAIGIAQAFRAAGGAAAFTWSGLTERDDVDMLDSRNSTASLLATAGTLAVTATSTSSSECAGVLALYESF